MGGLRDDGGRRSGEALLSAEEVAEYFGVNWYAVGCEVNAALYTLVRGRCILRTSP